MAATPPVCAFGWTPPAFTMPATNGKIYSLDQIAGPNGTLIMFICNHCPYVIGALDRIVQDAKDLQSLGIGVAAICSNDADAYPDDSFTKMRDLAEKHDFSFPYLHDESQSVAHSWGAVCTPDFFGFNADLKLQYRGRLDAAGPRPADPDTRRDLLLAMRQIAKAGQGPQDQIASMGCSIKWKAA